MVALALVVAVVGWLAWVYGGTAVVSEIAWSHEEKAVRSQWQQTPAPAPSPGDVLGLLRVPAWGAGYEVPILPGTGSGALAHGVGHYPSTAMPGQLGNFALAGHRVTHGQPFSRLPDLRRGDQLVVETRQAVYTYVVQEPARDLTVTASGGSWVLDPVPGERRATPTQALLTLTTAQDVLPTGDRAVAIARLSSATNKG